MSLRPGAEIVGRRASMSKRGALAKYFLSATWLVRNGYQFLNDLDGETMISRTDNLRDPYDGK